MAQPALTNLRPRTPRCSTIRLRLDGSAGSAGFLKCSLASNPSSRKPYPILKLQGVVNPVCRLSDFCPTLQSVPCLPHRVHAKMSCGTSSLSALLPGSLGHRRLLSSSFASYYKVRVTTTNTAYISVFLQPPLLFLFFSGALRASKL